MKILIPLTTGLLAVGASAQSLQLVNANSPGIYCHFDPNCSVSPTTQSGSFTPTNVAATCVLESRSFPGNSQDSQGQYGYEYRLTLNNNGMTSAGASSPLNMPATNILTVNSLTLNFGQPVPFAFAEHASNQVWLVTSGGPAGLPPASAEIAGAYVTIDFNPPLTLNTATDQTTSTLYFGMISDGAPEPATAFITGSAQDPVNGSLPFKAKLTAQAP